MQRQQHKWMRSVLTVASLYNLIWGAWVVLFPAAIFRLLAMSPPHELWIWKCLGMVVGVYGVAYAFAAVDPVRHWPVVAAGLLGKVLGPLGLVSAARSGELPWRFGWVCLTNDLIWWVPFALILRAAWRNFRLEPEHGRSLPWQRAHTEWGQALGELSFETPVLLVALRHGGCTFCREALALLAESRPEIEAGGTRIVLAHMGTPDAGAALAARYGLQDLARVADPNRLLYRAVGLRRGSIREVLGPHVLWRGLTVGVLGRHGVAIPVTDPFQMGGAFLLHQGRIEREFRYRDAADRPDFTALAI